MGVIRFGVDNYLVKFDDSYSEQLYAIQGETARSYIFTLEDIKDKVLDSFNVELKMVLYINGKAGIVKSYPLSDIYIEKEKRDYKEKVASKDLLENLLENIKNLSGQAKKDAEKEYQDLLELNKKEEKELDERIKKIKAEHKDKFFLKIPQGYLQESDKDATYQLFIINSGSGELLAQKEGSFVVYPNRNFQAGGENLLIDFSEFRTSMDKVLEIGDNLHLVNDVVSKADEITELFNLVKGISKDSELLEFSKEKSKIYGEIGKIAAKLEKSNYNINYIDAALNQKLEVSTSARKVKENLQKGERISMEYVIYSNNYCEIFVNVKVPLKINAFYQNEIWYGGYNWDFPFIFREAPIVSLAEAKWSTGISWGSVSQTTDRKVYFYIYNPLEGKEERTIIRFKVSGFLKPGSYVNPEFKEGEYL